MLFNAMHMPQPSDDYDIMTSTKDRAGIGICFSLAHMHSGGARSLLFKPGQALQKPVVAIAHCQGRCQVMAWSHGQADVAARLQNCPCMLTAGQHPCHHIGQVNKKLEEVLTSKNSIIRALQYDVAKVGQSTRVEGCISCQAAP